MFQKIKAVLEFLGGIAVIIIFSFGVALLVVGCFPSLFR